MIPIVKNQKYKEAAAATVSVLDRWGRRLGTVYLGQMPEAQQFPVSGEGIWRVGIIVASSAGVS